MEERLGRCNGRTTSWLSDGGGSVHGGFWMCGVGVGGGGVLGVGVGVGVGVVVSGVGVIALSSPSV
eukprot:scaffold42945_cov38-Attheya_sp.AAC.1